MNARKFDLEARQALWRMVPMIQIVYNPFAEASQIIHSSFPVAVARQFSTLFQTQLNDPSNDTISELIITTCDFRAIKATITWLEHYCKAGITDFTSSMLGYFPMLNIFKIQDAVNMLGISIMQTHLNNKVNVLATAASPLPTTQEVVRILDFPASHQARYTLCARLVAAIATGELHRDGRAFSTTLQADATFKAQVHHAIVEFDTEETRRRREAAEYQAKIDAIAAKKKDEKIKAQKEASKEYFADKRRRQHDEEDRRRTKKAKLANIREDQKDGRSKEAN